MDPMFKSGFHFTMGAICAIGICILVGSFLAPTDDSDGSYWDRSGMGVRVDRFTGCQYLKAGSLTPRLDPTGKQICRK